MHGIALGVYLIEIAGEEQGAVHVGIERALGVESVLSAVLDFYASEGLIPFLAALGLDAVEIAVAKLLEIEQSLLRADERRCHAGIHHLAFGGGEAHNGHGVVAGG